MYRVGIIGCGARGAGRTGAARGHEHWRAWAATGQCQLAAVADIVADNAAAFAEQYQDPAAPAQQFTDYRQMLAEAKLDAVSICTWPALHAPMVLAAIEAGVRAIHCEKPMAPTWAQARTMAEAVERAGTAIIYTHQRRFESQFRAARRLVRSGAIGELLQIEGTCPNLFDWGTHWLDMFHFYNDESPARWVMGQADVGRAPKTFGVPIEEQGMAWIAYANGVQAVLLTGRDRRWPEMNRLIGTKGVIEVQMVGPDGKGIPVRIRGEGDVDWRIPEIVAEDHPGPGGSVAAATRDLLHCLETGGEPELSGARAFRATELIFAIYESSRRGARVDLPLDVQDVSLADLARQRGVEV